MTRNPFCTVICVLAVTTLSSAALAQMGPPPGPLGPPPIVMMLQGVSLSTEQQAVVAAIMKLHQQTLAPLLDQLRTYHEQMAAMLVSSGTVTLSDFTSLEQQSVQSEQQLQQETLKTALDVRAILTPDQLAAAAANQKKMQEFHSEMRLIMGPAPGAP